MTTPGMHIKRRKRPKDEIIYQCIAVTGVAFALVVTVIPLLYVVSMSVTSQDALMYNGGRYKLIPDEVSLSGYQWLIKGGWMPRALFISFSRTALGCLCALFFTSMGAYVLSRRELPFRKPLTFLVLLSVLFIPGLMPNYLTISKLNLTNTFWVYIIPSLVDTWCLLVLKQFMEQLPESLYEAAIVDGANDPIIYAKIYLPLSLPSLAAVGLFIAVAHWNSWFDAFIYITTRSDLWPFQLVLRNILQGVMAMTNSSGMSSDQISQLAQVNGDSLKMAAVIVGTLPILCVYPFLQKYFTKGVLVGSVKG